MVISAVVGSMPYETGIRIAIPVAGPTPGSMPTSVPRKLPMTTQSRFVGVSAFGNPSIKFEKTASTRDSF